MGMNQSIHDQGLNIPAVTVNNNLLVASGTKVGIGTNDPKVPLDVFEMGGLYLGYTALAGSGASGSSYTATTSYAVIDSTAKVTFTAPKSGKVEIRLQCYVEDLTTSDKILYLALSDASSYNSIGAAYERFIYRADTEDEITLNVRWMVSGLTAGTSYTYYIAARSNAASNYTIRWGGTDADTYPYMLITAISVPNTTAS
jgi:hypothetical protein